MLAWELWTIIIYISRSPKQYESDVRVYDGDGDAWDFNFNPSMDK